MIKKMFQTRIVTERRPFKNPSKAYRGKISLNPHLCTQCKTCEHICPAGAIQLSETKDEPSATLTFDYTKCIYCGLCVEHCPTGALDQLNIAKRASRQKHDLIETFHIGNQQTDSVQTKD